MRVVQSGLEVVKFPNGVAESVVVDAVVTIWQGEEVLVALTYLVRKNEGKRLKWNQEG